MKDFMHAVLTKHRKTVLYSVSTSITVFLLMFTLHAAAGAKRMAQKQSSSPQSQIQNTESARVISEVSSTKSKEQVEQRVIPEWQAFAVYHPTSGLSEDLLFQNIKRRHSDDASAKAGINEEGAMQQNSMQILGSRALIPILRDAFGVQARGQTAAERDPWFLTHPTSLFSPAQMKALCDPDVESALNEGSEICWKPRLSDDYLSTLTDFASDACPQLVIKESSQTNRGLNKLMRSEEFRTQDLKYFAVTWLKIPSEKVTDEWLADLVNHTKKSMGTELNDKSEENLPDFTREDLYGVACQAMLLSREFYTR